MMTFHPMQSLAASKWSRVPQSRLIQDMHALACFVGDPCHPGVFVFPGSSSAVAAGFLPIDRVMCAVAPSWPFQPCAYL